MAVPDPFFKAFVADFVESVAHAKHVASTVVNCAAAGLAVEGVVSERAEALTSAFLFYKTGLGFQCDSSLESSAVSDEFFNFSLFIFS